MLRPIMLILCFAAAVVLFWGESLKAQDSSAVNTDNRAEEQVTARDEIVFDEIQIEGVIDKPNVSILPTRTKPEFDKLEFVGRSFDSEIKALPPHDFLFDIEFDAGQQQVRVGDILSQITKKK